MKKKLLLFAAGLCLAVGIHAQTLYVPGGTGGIGSSSNANIGIGTNAPNAILHIKSGTVDRNLYDANLIIEATSISRTLDKGVAIGFVVPANTDGSNSWQQGRILVTPDNNSNYNASGRMYLQTRYFDGGGQEWKWRNNLVLNSLGYVGIGIIDPAYKLDVCGTIRAKEIKVDLQGGCDFVFKNDYKLMDLKTLEQFVIDNQHLPEIASEKEMVENGVNIKELQMKLLQKMEEMTLYVIDLKKENERQAKKIETLEKTVNNLIAK